MDKPRFDNHCQTCLNHRDAILFAERMDDNRSVEVHVKLAWSHWRKDHDRSTLLDKLFGKHVITTEDKGD